MKREPYRYEIEIARAICAPFGCEVSPSTHAFEIATVKGDGVSILLYPHRTKTTRNISVRVRNNGSKDPGKAARVLHALTTGEGLPEEDRNKVLYSNMFTCKTMPAGGEDGLR